MAQEIIHIDELCRMCGYFAENEPETHNGHDYGCDHRDNMGGDKMCMASACPLGWLAEAEHFMEINGCSKEEAEDNAKQEDCIVWDAD